MPKPDQAFVSLQVRTGKGSSSTTRYLYLKLHSQSGDDAAPALFIVGLGTFYDQFVLVELFGVFGPVAQVIVHEHKVCHMTYGRSGHSVLTILSNHDSKCRHQHWLCLIAQAAHKRLGEQLHKAKRCKLNSASQQKLLDSKVSNLAGRNCSMHAACITVADMVSTQAGCNSTKPRHLATGCCNSSLMHGWKTGSPMKDSGVQLPQQLLQMKAGQL